MKLFARSALVAAALSVLAIVVVDAQPSPGPGPAPSPWVVNGPSIYYDNGGVLVPSTVTGGTKGVGTINADGLYVSNIPVLTTSSIIPLANLATVGANTVLANFTSSTGAVTANSMPSCPDVSGQHLNYVSGTGITCGSDTSGNIILTQGNILVGNALNIAVGVPVSGDASVVSSGAFTVSKVNGVSYGTLPSTNTVPVVTGTNTITYEAVPNAALANSAVTIAGHLVSLGGSTTLSCSDLTDAGSGCSGLSGINQLTGDVLAGPGTGSQATTLATVNADVGAFGSSTAIPTLTVNAKGLVTAVSENAVIAPAGTLTGTTLASNVVTASLTTINGSTVPTATDTFTLNAASQALTNKDIDAASNTLSNIDTTMFAANVIDNDPTLAAQSASRLPTQQAVYNFVTNGLNGLHWKTAAIVRTTANITLSGEQTIDGVLTSASRVLVMAQSDATQNGIYVSASGAWSRSTDADTGTELLNSTIFVSQGTTWGGSQWTNTNTSITIGVTNITFGQMSGPGTYSAGTGLQLIANQFSIDSTVATLTGAQTLTNKGISGAANTLTNIPLSAFTNLGTTSTVLHGNASGNPTFGQVAIGTEVSGLGTGVATLLSGASSGTGGPAGTTSPNFSGTIGLTSTSNVTPLTVTAYSGHTVANPLFLIKDSLGGTLMSFNTDNELNIFIGKDAGLNNVLGTYPEGTANNFIGYQAGKSNTLGNYNTALGDHSLTANTIGTSNTGLGPNSLIVNVDGTNNTAVGRNTLYSNVSGSGNVAVGYIALNKSTGSFLTAVGSGALAFTTTGTPNTGVGYGVMNSNTTGSKNVAVGSNAGFYTQAGSDNTLIGTQAGFGVAANDYSGNTFVGSFSGWKTTTGSQNTLIGAMPSGTNANLTSGSQNILLGYNIQLPSATANGQLNIGNFVYGTGLTGTGSTLSVGSIGIGTKTPGQTLDVVGSIGASGQIVSTLATGTAPLVVASTTQVANLNAATAGTATNLAGGTNGAIPYQSAAGTTSLLAATATAGQVLRSGASSAPSWSTATFPATAGTAGNVLRSDGTNFASTTLAASDLSNGTSGAGAVLLAASPTTTGTLTGAISNWSGALTVGGTSGSSGTPTGFIGIGVLGSAISPVNVAINNNNNAQMVVRNYNAGASAQARFSALADTASLSAGVYSSGTATSGAIVGANNVYVFSSNGNMVVGTLNTNDVIIARNNIQVGTFTSTGMNATAIGQTTAAAGSFTTLSSNAGMVAGSPTGGNKGAGTLNVATDIYKNNTAYTNPDYVLEKWSTGKIIKFANNEGASRYDGLKPLGDVEAFVKKNFVLPRIAEARQAAANDNKSIGLFGGGDALLASVEEAYLYLFRIKAELGSLWHAVHHVNDNGVTTIDRGTHKPVCMYVENMVMKVAAGACR